MNDFWDKIDRALSTKRLTILLLVILMLFSSTNLSVCVNAVEYEDDEASVEEAPIIVSMGDSYSAGEGIEDFYDQYLDNMDKVQSEDWLAHRSEKSWPGMLKFPGLDGIAREHKDTNWFFVAASGAETKHLEYEQSKDYSRGFFPTYSGTAYLPPQLAIFEELQPNSVDYVTLTLGGNDAGFTDIITEAVTGSTYLNHSKLTDMIADVWIDYYKKGGIRDDLYDSYKAIEEAAGPQAQIIVAGYPKLLDQNGGGWPFSLEEAMVINQAVNNFNIEIERIIDYCAGEGMKICFVSVESAFDGHEVWSSRPFINPVYLGPKGEELKNFVPASSYSVHPNYDGAIVYAQCVNEKIEQLAEEEAARIEEEALNPSDKKHEIVLVLDQSGSMDGEPMQETIAAAKKFVGTALKSDANVGVVTYAQHATVCSALTDSEKYLNSKISEIQTGGGTNIEAGLEMADSMLEDSSAEKRVIVLMSDGEPNEGKVEQDLIDYANSLKEKGYYIYTLGFFSAIANKDAAVALMEAISSDGNHFEVDDAESLKFFFGDIADQISGTRYIYIRIACPVDVTVKCNGEKMTSKGSSTSVRTSFGTMTFEENTEEENKTAAGGMLSGSEEDAPKNDNRIKILRLKEGAEYNIQIRGNGKGKMNYTIGFMDEDGEYSDMRRFSNIRITDKTKIETVAAISEETYMYVDQDGDGKHDVTYRAEPDSKAKAIDYSIYIYIGLGILAALVLTVVVLLLVRRAKIRRYL